MIRLDSDGSLKLGNGVLAVTTLGQRLRLPQDAAKI
jgi:hypothetical protein